MSSSSPDQSSSEPSMARGHAAYAAGVVKETIGSYTSTEMQNAGTSDKQAAVQEMRAAKAQSEQQAGGDVSKNPTLGKVEQTLGSATGCEGMQEEGAKRVG